MNISLRAVHMDRTPQLDMYIEKKIQLLGRYAENIKQVSVELLGDMHHRKGGVIRVEMILRLVQAGSQPLRVEETASDIHEAIDMAVATMKKNIIAYKEKKIAVKKDIVRTVRGK
ncbi:ribosome-associated translation inhibitor RaiA [Candidatus Uhrbacteria bacterium]|nr:ribosome-associated translation inhibitor RaiA [Candidatus Uhrbacteria bacterium]